MTDWWTVAVSVLGSGGVSAGTFGLLNGHLQRRLTMQVEASKNAAAEKLKHLDAQIAEADRKSALALRRDDSRMTTLIQVSRLAADGEALANNATVEMYDGDVPLSPMQAYTNSGRSSEDAASDAARLESDAYFFSPKLGSAVSTLRECKERLRWESTENRSPVEAFDVDDPLIKALRTAALDVRDQVQMMLRAWEQDGPNWT